MGVIFGKSPNSDFEKPEENGILWFASALSHISESHQLPAQVMPGNKSANKAPKLSNIELLNFYILPSQHDVGI